MRALTALAVAALTSLLVLVVVGCAPGAASTPADLLPGNQAVADWTQQSAPQSFTADNLYDLVDGQADAFFAYGLDAAALGRYAGPDGAGLRIELFRLASPDDAYGLYSISIAGDRVAVGTDGDTDPGRRLAFWQDRFYVRIQAAQPVPDEILRGFGQAVARALPAGTDRPALVEHLPAAGLEPRGARLFHQEISIQSWLWLGGDNLLGLSSETDGVLADYGLNGRPAQLLLIVYPNAEQAQAAQQALERSDVDALLVAGVDGPRLGAVFGTADPSLAKELLEEALP